MTRAVLLDLYGTLVKPDWGALTAGRDAIADRVGVPRAAAREAWSATHEARMRGQHGSLEGDLAVVLAMAGGVESDVFTDDLIETWIRIKREEELEVARQRPTPTEFELYYSI